MAWLHSNGVFMDVNAEVKETIFPGAACLLRSLLSLWFDLVSLRFLVCVILFSTVPAGFENDSKGVTETEGATKAPLNTTQTRDVTKAPPKMKTTELERSEQQTYGCWNLAPKPTAKAHLF